jgi:small-conductance mechanosensitive channel
MIKSLFLLAVLVLSAAPLTGGWAQQPQPAQPAGSALSAPEAQRALEVLQDPQRRDQLIATLKALAKTAPPAAEPAPTPAATPEIALKPDSLGAQLLVALAAWSTRLGHEAAAALQTMNNLPALWRWFATLESDPEAARSLLLSGSWMALVIAIALILEFLTAWALRRPRAALNARTISSNGGDVRLLRLLPYALARLLLDLASVAVFAAAGNLLVGGIPDLGQHARLVVIAIVNAYAACRAVMCVARMLLPDDRRLRLWRLDDETARFTLVWVRRLAIVAIAGNALVEVAVLLGLDQRAHDGFQRLIVLLLAAMLIVVVIRSRRTVARYLRGSQEARWRDWLAESWPYLAVMTIISYWIGMATGAQGGLSGLYFPGVTLVAIIAARLVLIVVLGLLERTLRIDPEADATLPGLATRAASYRRPLELVATAVITALCVVVVLQLWGAPAFAWFVAGGIGARFVSALATVAVAMIAAIAIWEVSQAMLARQLAQTGPGGQVRSVRLLTLLPILRTTLLVVITAIVGLTALSEIGVDIAPLLAGAGIAGIAIGFGSQTLVKDVITGVFVLFENVIKVGDWVTVAGLSGTVEQLSVRTIRLRGLDGGVHVIPFSAVTTLTNNNRGRGNATVSVTVAYQEDTDRVVETIRAIVDEMRTDEVFAPSIIDDFALWGVDAVHPWGVTILGQIPCVDTGRWSVQREFNRRMKMRFTELGIEIAGSPQAVARK